jgi:glycosyltransferase involved in cell wall biosynthesis
MKLLIDGRVLTHKKVTGVENHAINIIKKLQEKTEVDVIIPKYKNKYYTHFWEHFILPFKALKYKILFCPSNIGPLYLPKKVNLIITLHDLSFKDFPQMYSPLFRQYYEFIIPKVLKRANRVLTISKSSQHRITKEYLFVEDKISFIYHGLNESFFYNKNLPKKDYVLYIGSLNDTKNFSSVIQAFTLLNIKNYNLVMIMPTSSNFLINSTKKELLKNAQKNPKITIMDYVKQKELIKVYQHAKLFIFPSYHESFGFPVIEAMACGTPVICSHTSSLPEVGGDAVIYCDPNDINDIRTKMELVLNNEALQKELIQKGLERSKTFSWEKTAQQHIELFEEVLKS